MYRREGPVVISPIYPHIDQLNGIIVGGGYR